ncbi:MAG TPA: hypothetical protein VGM51_18175 [Armatimonadota bacterium]|jgi:hypothetical protein
MSIVNPESLAATLDALNEALFEGRALSDKDRHDAAVWIACRQGLAGAYRGMPAPTAEDFAKGAKLFTGEAIRSRVGTAHILGEEACRALMLLRPLDDDGVSALAKSQVWLREPEMNGQGHYCCGICSVSLWRHLATRPWPEAEAALAAGMRILRERRVEGAWRPHPFWYTVLALTEIGLPGATEELRYAAPKLETYLRSSARPGIGAARRRQVAERALARL